MTVHRVTSSEGNALVNAYLIETPNGVVAVDAMLTVSDGRELRRRVEVPILAPQGVHALAAMHRYLPTDELSFLMELSVDPVAAQLGLSGVAVDS
jgi:hypothetical protein